MTTPTLMTRLRPYFIGFLAALLTLVLAGAGWGGYHAYRIARASAFLSQTAAIGKDGQTFTYADVLRDVANTAVQNAIKQQPQPAPDSK